MSECQEGAVIGQKIPQLLQAPQLQTVGLLQLHGEAHEETQCTAETTFTQQEVKQQSTLFSIPGHDVQMFV